MSNNAELTTQDAKAASNFPDKIDYAFPVDGNITEHVWYFGSPNIYCEDPSKRKELYDKWYEERLKEHLCSKPLGSGSQAGSLVDPI